MRGFRSSIQRMPKVEDSFAERSEFETQVPVSKLSYDSIMLALRSRRVAKRCCPALRFWRALVFVVGSGGAKMELPLFGTQLQNQSRCGACRRRLPLNVATVAPNRHWCFGRSRQLVSASQIITRRCRLKV